MNGNVANVFDIFEDLASQSTSLTVSPTTGDNGKGDTTSSPTSSSRWLGQEVHRITAAPALSHGRDDSSQASSSVHAGKSSTSTSETSSAHHSRKTKTPRPSAQAASSTEAVLLPLQADGPRPTRAPTQRPTSSAKSFNIGDEDDKGASGKEYEHDPFWSSSVAAENTCHTAAAVDMTVPDSDDTVDVPDQYAVAAQLRSSAATQPPKSGGRGRAVSAGAPARRRPSTSPRTPSLATQVKRAGTDFVRQPSTPRRRRTDSTSSAGMTRQQIAAEVESKLRAELDQQRTADQARLADALASMERKFHLQGQHLRTELGDAESAHQQAANEAQAEQAARTELSTAIREIRQDRDRLHKSASRAAQAADAQESRLRTEESVAQATRHGELLAQQKVSDLIQQLSSADQDAKARDARFHQAEVHAEQHHENAIRDLSQRLMDSHRGQELQDPAPQMPCPLCPGKDQRIAQQSADLVTAANKLTHSRLEIETITGERNALRAQLHHLSTPNEILTKQNAELDTKIQTVTGERDALRAQVHQFSELNELLITQNGEVHHKLNTSQADVTSLQHKLVEFQEEAREVTPHVSSLESQPKSSHAQMLDLTERLRCAR